MGYKMKLTRNQKDNLRYAIIMAVLMSFFLSAIALVSGYAKGQDAEAMFEYALCELRFIAIGIVALPACGLILWRVFKWIDSDAASTACQMAGLKISEKMREKNFQEIYPRLREFLFYVLAKNNDGLALPLGNDACSLSPFGARHVIRNGCLFYQFQLIMPEAPDWPCDVLRSLMQSYVNSELQNYGIAGLNGSFTDTGLRSWKSVYIDRLFTDEASHVLTIELLYISSNAGARYLQKALRRDNASPEREQAVYDDELK